MTDSHVDALPVRALFADTTYQRDRDEKRCRKMAEAFDRRLLGVVQVSDRGDDTYAILDGQHRHGAALLADPDSHLVCEIYTGLTRAAEAELFHELNARRKALSFWDRWKSRRASGDERVLAIEQVLADHNLQVHPAPTDGNVAAMSALETIVDDLGDLHLLDSVVALLIAAFGRSRDAFNGGLMHGLALVLCAYDWDEIDMDRLVAQLSEVPVRQMKARASGLRELHRGTYPRLFAGVIVEQYNRGPGRKLEPFFTRLPERAVPRRAAAKRTPATRGTDSLAGPPHEVGEPGVRHEPRPAPGADLTGTSTGRPEGKAGGDVAHASPPAATKLPPSPAMAICTCGHTQRRHENTDGAHDGICLVGDGDCGCSGYSAAAVA